MGVRLEVRLGGLRHRLENDALPTKGRLVSRGFRKSLM